MAKTDPIKPNVTLSEFLSGETLRYRGCDARPTEATYRAGDGVYLERKGEDLGKADVVADEPASRFYVNVTRGAQR